MKIGYYQFHPEFRALKQNLEKVQDSLSAVEADIIVLPELAFTGYFFEDRRELSELAEDISDSPTLKGLTRLCRDSDFHIITGFAERYQERIYNSALVVGPLGLVHRYRKLHLFNTEKGRHNFMTIACRIDSMDWLILRVLGNRRARFEWDNTGLSAKWLIP